jgi:hypothetical protein
MQRDMLQMRTTPRGIARIRRRADMTTDISARMRAILEEELGELRRFADLPASEIETMAARRAPALEPVMELPAVERRPAA